MLPPAGEVWTFFRLACNPSQLSGSISQRSRCGVFILLTLHVNQNVTVQSINKNIYLYPKKKILSEFLIISISSIFFARVGEPLPCLGQNYITIVLSGSKLLPTPPFAPMDRARRSIVLHICYSVLWFLLCVLFWERQKVHLFRLGDCFLDLNVCILQFINIDKTLQRFLAALSAWVTKLLPFQSGHIKDSTDVSNESKSEKFIALQVAADLNIDETCNNRCQTWHQCFCRAIPGLCQFSVNVQV
jgi:hypothetical protein